MKLRKTIDREHHGSRCALRLGLLCSLLLVGMQPAAAQQDYNSFSRMVRLTSTWQSNFYSDIIRTNAAKGSFGEISSAPRITQQDVQNLCKPFPCGNEGTLSSAPASPTYATPTPNRAAAAPRSYPITATDFRPPRGRIVPDEVSRMSPGTADEKVALRDLSNQFLDNFDKEARKNNIAYSFTFLTGVSIQIVIGRDLSDAETDQLIAGFNNSIASTPQFAAMSAYDKQVLQESAVVTAGMIAFLDEQGKLHNDAKMRADARQLAKEVIAYFFGVQVK